LLLATTPFTLTGGYGLGPGDSITRNGLQTIAAQFWNRTLGPLPADSILKAAQAAEITSRVNALNAQIVNAARANGAVIYDLNAFVRRMRVAGAVAGNSAVSADYLGGFYSLDGVYPGITGHALIANDILAFLNQTYRTAFAAVDVPSVAARDPALSYRKPAPVAGALNEVLR
jgi:phospholipase/lecithinase/hemolysin